MSTAFYPNTESHETPTASVRKSSTQWADLPLSRFDIDALQARGIKPELAKTRGIRTMTAAEARAAGFTNVDSDAMAIPVYNLAGEFDDYLLRPHAPVVDRETGKKRKYLWRPGHTPALGGPPAGTASCENRAHALREAINVPVIVTESVLKGDSVLAHANTDVYSLAIHGTWNWVSNGATSPELRDVPWRVKKAERVVQRRTVVLVPDSDYATKAEVALGWWNFGSALQRKNADVRIFVTPAAADGSKLGPDDALAQGLITVDQVLTEAVPLGELPEYALHSPVSSKDERIAQLEAENARQASLITAQSRLIQSPFLKDKERSLSYRVITMAAHKASRGDVDDRGMVHLSAAELANDWRKIPEKGERAADTNTDGSYPIAKRATVKSILGKLSGVGGVPVGFEKVKRETDEGDRYIDTGIVVRAEDVSDTTAAITSLADFKREKARKQYQKQEPCPSCGEVHSRTRTTVCDGCGSILNEETLNLPPASLPTEELSDSQRESLDDATAMTKNVEAINDAPYIDTHSPDSITNCRQNLSRQNPTLSSPIATEPETCIHPLNGGCDQPTEYSVLGRGSTHHCQQHSQVLIDDGRASA